ncbi:hypothetical protein ACF0H5_008508 [Mactra antiquata]
MSETTQKQQIMLSIRTFVSAKLIRNTKVRINNYVDDVMPLYRVDDFKDGFRMSRSTFEQLLEDLTPVLNNRGNNLKVGPQKQLLIFHRLPPFFSKVHVYSDI